MEHSMVLVTVATLLAMFAAVARQGVADAVFRYEDEGPSCTVAFCTDPADMIPRSVCSSTGRPWG